MPPFAGGDAPRCAMIGFNERGKYYGAWAAVCVRRTLLSAPLTLLFEVGTRCPLSRPQATNFAALQSTPNIKSGGQECPPHTGSAIRDKSRVKMKAARLAS
jgi:hypothetical protein